MGLFCWLPLDYDNTAPIQYCNAIQANIRGLAVSIKNVHLECLFLLCAPVPFLSYYSSVCMSSEGYSSWVCVCVCVCVCLSAPNSPNSLYDGLFVPEMMLCTHWITRTSLIRRITQKVLHC